MTINELLDGIKEGAVYAGEFAARTAVTAGKKAGEVFTTSKYNLVIFDLKNDIVDLYREIGELLYETHINGKDNTEQVENKLTEIDAKRQRIDEIRDLIDDIKDTKTCKYCGTKSEKSAEYCKKCGSEL